MALGRVKATSTIEMSGTLFLTLVLVLVVLVAGFLLLTWKIV